MKRLFFIGLILCLFFSFNLPSRARDRVVANIGKTEIVSEGLYLKISDVNITQTMISVTVQVKNKSMLSQAVYLELVDSNGNIYPPQNKDSIKLFGPLKFNKLITQKLVFNTHIPCTNSDYKLAIYSKDIFKKNKKSPITQLSVKEAKKELSVKR